MFQEIKLNKIKEDLNFDYKINHTPEYLVHSIKNNGILSPVHVIKKEADYFLWSGFKRFRVAKYLKLESIPVFIDQNSIDFKKRFLHHLEINRHENNLNLIEIAHIIRLGSNHDLSQEKLGFQFPKNEINFLNKLNELPDNIKLSYSKREISDFTLRTLIGLLSNKISLISDLISYFRMSFQHQREFLNMAIKIKRNKKEMLDHILNDFSVHFKLNLNNQEKKKILNELFVQMNEHAYPTLNQLNNRFNISKKELHLPPNIQIHSYPYFSKPGFLLQWAVHEKIDWEDGIHKLNNLNNNQHLDQMFKL